MNTPLTIVAQIEAQKDSIAFVKEELIKLIAPTRSEAGCIQYDLHQDNENSALFLFYENWESRELWQTHMASAHLQNYMKVTEGKVANFILNEMGKIA